MNQIAKLRVGWFSFSCCEDSTIVFTELLNDHYQDWRNKMEFVYFLPLQKKTDLSVIDLAFIEGAVTSETQATKVLEIRQKAKKVVAIGACALVGMPSGQRNFFDQTAVDEISPILARFAYAPNVKKITDIIKVDDQVPGCPMDEEIFLKIINQYLSEFNLS